jgi:quercetin dioxygenase-like cupin family protein
VGTVYRAGVERWHIPSIEADGRREPRVLFSCREARAVVIDLRDGEGLGEHSVHERAVLQVIDGRIDVVVAEATTSCDAGTLITFEPGERHAVKARGDARVLLMLSPWPGAGHFPAGAAVDAARMPANATARPL